MNHAALGALTSERITLFLTLRNYLDLNPNVFSEFVDGLSDLQGLFQPPSANGLPKKLLSLLITAQLQPVILLMQDMGR